MDGLDSDADDYAYPGTLIEKEMVPYIEQALSGKVVYSNKIVDTTWGHIFTACYPVEASDGTGDIIGALCMEWIWKAHMLVWKQIIIGHL